MKAVSFLLAVFLTAGFFSAGAQSPTGQLLQGHSHNDYEQDIPFWAAYNAGFGSIEADIWLVNGELLVAHDRKELSLHRTLWQYYLIPLLNREQENNGRPYPQGGKKLQLLIDVKSDAVPTLRALIALLQSSGGLVKDSLLQIVISGNRPPPETYAAYPPFIWFDGVLRQTYAPAALARIKMMSDNLTAYTTWNGAGGGGPQDREKIQAAIAKSHSLGKPVRFWEAPDQPGAWEALAAAGVDYLNTDHINALADWLEHQQQPLTGAGVAGIAIPGQPLPAWQEGMLDIHHINTGRGNAAFLIFPDSTTLVVDAGELDPTEARTASDRNTTIRPNGRLHPYEWIAAYIRQVSPAREGATIDYALITHFHDDHFGGWYPGAPMAPDSAFCLSGITGLGTLLPVGQLLTRDYRFPQDPDKRLAGHPEYERYLRSWTNYKAFVHAREMTGKPTNFLRAGSATQIALRHPKQFPSVTVRNIKSNGFIWTGTDSAATDRFAAVTDPKTWPDENSLSNAILVTYGGFRYYTGGDNPGNPFPGDASDRDLETPIARVVGAVDVATMDHHGNRDAVNANLVRTLHPRVWVEQVWTADHPGHETLIRVTSPAYDPGPKDLFATNMMEANRAVIGHLVDEAYKSTQGHVLVRVLPGGKQYYVIVLDDASETMAVKAVFGPYTAGEKDRAGK